MTAFTQLRGPGRKEGARDAHRGTPGVKKKRREGREKGRKKKRKKEKGRKRKKKKEKKKQVDLERLFV